VEKIEDSIGDARELTEEELLHTLGGGWWDTVKGAASAVATAVFDTAAVGVYTIVDTYHLGPRDAVQSSVYRTYGALNKFANNLRNL
jgi:hypothetical protein